MFAGAIFTGVWTDRLWFRSLGYSEVFNKILLTRAALFIILGAFFAAVVCANIVIAHRTQPLLVPAPSSPRSGRPLPRGHRADPQPAGRGRVRAAAAVGGWHRCRALADVPAVAQRPALRRTDAEFNKDIGFFVFDYPVVPVPGVVRVLRARGQHHRGGVVNYLYGGISLQNRSGRITGPRRSSCRSWSACSCCSRLSPTGWTDSR
jgi:uncharacterized membrane protein (UPF0182 family)